MYGEYLKLLISFIVAPIKVIFIPSPQALQRYNFCYMILVQKVIKEIVTAK